MFIEALFLLWDWLFYRIISLAKKVLWAIVVGVIIRILCEMLAGLNWNRIDYLCRWFYCCCCSWFKCYLFAKRRCLCFWFYLEHFWKLWAVFIKVNCVALGFLIIFLNVIFWGCHNPGRLLIHSWKGILLWKGMIMVTIRAWENLSIGLIFSSFHCITIAIKVMCLLLILRLAIRWLACYYINLDGRVIIIAKLNVILTRLD